MKCDSCKTVIDAKFSFAIKNNQCPACGQSIMAQDKLAAYLSLRNLFSEVNVKAMSDEDIALLVVTNFELRQKFVETVDSSPEPSTEAVSVSVTEETAQVIQEEPSKEDAAKSSDDEFKKKQQEEAKAIIKKMRDEAYEDALRENWGLANPDGEIFEPGDSSMHETVTRAKQEQQRQNIVTGSRGAFRRG